MSVTITIQGVDRTDNVEYSSFNLNRALSSQIDVLRFDVIRKGSAEYKPAVLDTVVVLEGATTIFGGQIVEIESIVADGSDIEKFSCVAKDYSFDMDRSLVTSSYSSQTVNAIIADINTSFLPSGYDITNVNCAIVIDYIAFNYEQPSKCFQQLAQLTNYDWYVDHDKKIYFFSKTALTAPFDLTDDNGMYYFNTLKIKDDVSNIRNTITVRGGEYLGALDSETQIADGTALNYLQAYQYNTVFVEVNGVAKTVGIDFVDDPALFDCLYNFQEKTVRFKAGTLPTAGHTVEVGGYPYIPVIVKVQDNASIALYGKFEFKIVDKSIDSRAGAIARAEAEFTQWGYSITDGYFETKEAGLEVGQVINVQSTIRGLNTDYVISRINDKLAPNGTEFLHSVTLMTTQTFGMIEFLQKLLMDKDKEIKINEGEVLNSIYSFSDTATLSDGISTPAVTSPPYLWDSFTWNYFTWS